MSPLVKTIKEADILGLLNEATVVGDRPWKLNLKVLRAERRRDSKKALKDSDKLLDGLWEWIAELERIRNASSKVIKSAALQQS